MDYEIKDSGNRQSFSTGSVRDTEDGKPRYDLVPTYPLSRLSQHYFKGSKKYGMFNWQKGQNIRRYLSSLLRHAAALTDGLEDEDHAAAVAWNSFAIMWTRNEIKEGRRTEELEDVFTDAQFQEFYGWIRGTKYPVPVPVAQKPAAIPWTGQQRVWLTMLTNSNTAPTQWSTEIQEFAERLEGVTEKEIWEYTRGFNCRCAGIGVSGIVRFSIVTHRLRSDVAVKLKDKV